MTLTRCRTTLDVATSGARLFWSAVSGADGAAHAALTGGGLGIDTVRAIISSAPADLPDLHVWWGDERFVPRDDGDRNDIQAAEAGLAEVSLPPSRVHRVAGREESSLTEAAQAYDRALREVVPSDGTWPRLDVILLGLGEDGHVASLFPGRQWADGDRCAVAVEDSPKPPPERVSLTMPVLAAAGLVVLVTGGSAKADALRRATSSDRSVPAGELLALREERGLPTHVLADAEALPR